MYQDDSLDDLVEAIERMGHGVSYCDDPERRHPVGQCTPLMRAVRADRLDLVERLIEARANVNAIVNERFLLHCLNSLPGMNNVLVLALDHCRVKGTLDSTRLDIIKCLIKAGAALNPTEDESRAAWHWYRPNCFICHTPLFIACEGRL